MTIHYDIDKITKDIKEQMAKRKKPKGVVEFGDVFRQCTCPQYMTVNCYVDGKLIHIFDNNGDFWKGAMANNGKERRLRFGEWAYFTAKNLDYIKEKVQRHVKQNPKQRPTWSVVGS